MTTENIDPAVLKTKQHFEVLDGMRGVAAVAIVVFHFMEWVYSDSSKNFIGHGFLAVDFFFCLSGFVIAYAYDDRIQVMGIREFFRSRLIRLHPLVILGSVLGVVGLLVDPFANVADVYGFTQLALLFFGSIFLIPLPVMKERSFNLFSLNAPSWSLFWEYVANIVYAFILYRLARRYLVILVVVAGIILSFVAYRAGNLLGGWAGENFWDGSARIAYSFSAGLLIYRSNWIIKNRIGFLGLGLLLALAFLIPHFKWNWIVELLLVLLYFPLMVALGAGTQPTSWVKKVCRFSGRISYPLYMTHYAVIWIFGNYYLANKPGVGTIAVIVSVGSVVLICVAYLVMRFYDEPVREYLRRKRLKL